MGYKATGFKEGERVLIDRVVPGRVHGDYKTWVVVNLQADRVKHGITGVYDNSGYKPVNVSMVIVHPSNLTRLVSE
jgi:hypothetical protein